MEELLKAYSDIPIALLACIFAFKHFRNKNGDKNWGIFFFMLFVSASLGVFVHLASPSLLTKRIVWAILYILLYRNIRRLTGILSMYIAGENFAHHKGIRICEICCLVGSVLLMLEGNSTDILFLAIYCLMAVTLLFIKAMQCHFKDRNLTMVFICGALAALFQGFSRMIPYGVTIGHLFIIVALVFAYLTSKENILYE